MCGDNYYVSNSSVKGVKNITQANSVASSVSDALRSGGTSSTGTRFKRAGSGSKKEKYKNISEGMLPYDVSVEGIDVRESIELCQKAYANIPIFRNAVDVMSEFSNSSYTSKSSLIFKGLIS